MIDTVYVLEMFDNELDDHITIGVFGESSLARGVHSNVVWTFINREKGIWAGYNKHKPNDLYFLTPFKIDETVVPQKEGADENPSNR